MALSAEGDAQEVRRFSCAYARSPSGVHTSGSKEAYFSFSEDALSQLASTGTGQPLPSEVVSHLAMMLGTLHKYSLLVDFLNAKVPKFTRDSVAWELKAYAQHSLGRENDAINTLRSLVKHNPQQHHLLHMAAFRSAAGEDAGQTIQSAKTALDRSAGIGFKRAAHLATALALENSSIEYGADIAEAIQHVEAALELDADDYKIICRLARLKAIAGAPVSEVIGLAQRALKAGGMAYGPAWLILAAARASHKQYNKAISALDAGLLESGPHHSLLLMSAKVQVLLSANEPEKALDALRQLMAHVQRGTVRQEVMESSVQDVLTTVAGSMWAQGVYVFLALKQLKDAQFCVDRALSLQPSSATSHYLAGLLHEANGQFDAARCSFETAMAINPRYADAEIKCGALYGRSQSPGDLVISRDLLVSGLKHRPNTYLGWLNLGLVNRAESRLDEAEEDLRNAVLLQMKVFGLLHLLPK